MTETVEVAGDPAIEAEPDPEIKELVYRIGHAHAGWPVDADTVSAEFGPQLKALAGEGRGTVEQVLATVLECYEETEQLAFRVA